MNISLKTKTMRTTVALAVAMTAVLAAGMRAQQIRDSSAPAAPPKMGTAIIAGTVVTDGQQPQPVRRATVSVTNIDGSVARTTFTDEAGRFTLSGLPEGRYNLIANKAPFLRSSYGAKRYDLPGTPITLKDAGKMTDITLRLMRGAVLSGRITDENGEPAFGVNVRAMLLRTQAGERTFVPSASGTSADTTDDHGVFRLFGLPPGEYAITASPRLQNGEIQAMTETEIRNIMQALQQQTAAQNAQAVAVTVPGQKPATPTPSPTPTPDPNRVTVAYSTVFYPGTTVAASAGTVTVGPGDERTGIDFPLRLVRTTTVEGMVVVPAGMAPQSVQLMMVPNTGGSGSGLASLDMMSMPFQRVAVGPDGRFKYTAVAPGQYTISAQATKPVGGGPNGPPPPPPPPPPPGMAAGGGQTMTFTRMVATAGPGGGGGGEMPMDLMMIGGDPNGAAYWAQVDLGVDGTPLSGVTLTLQPGMTITGKVEFRSANVRSGDFKRVQLTLMPAPTGGGLRISTSFPVVQVDETGKFTVTGVVPGRYTLRGNAPLAPGSPPGGAWRLGSAVIKGRDILDFPLDVQPNEDISDALIVFTDATQSIGGSLQDASGRPAPDYTIVVFSADKAYWTLQSRRVRTVRPGTDGRFTVTNLPAGDYRMAAVVDMAPTDINDPAFLEQLVGASFAVKLAVGEQKTQDLKISGGL